MTKPTRTLLPLALLALVLAPAGCGDDAQSTPQSDASIPLTGAIAGAVTDGDGAALAGAQVTTDPASTTVTTDAQGAYELADLAAGTYKVMVTKDGFTAQERAAVAVAAGATVTLDFVLHLASGGWTLTVNDLCGTGGLDGATVTVDGSVAGTTGAGGVLALDGLTPGTYTLELSAAGYLPKSVEVTVAAEETASATADLECQTKAVGDMARAFMATLDATFSAVLPANKLHDEWLYDADTTNDPVAVISVRKPEDYAKGHVPGAINLPWKTVADDPIATLGQPFTAGAKYVDYCYTGHTGGIAAGVLNLLGYKTWNMKFGIWAWTDDANARATATAPDYTHDFTFETTANTATATHDLPWLAFADVTTAWAAAQAAAKAYLSNATMAPTIDAAAVHDLITDADTTNDPVIISVRKPEDYAKGHVPGAINIPYATIALEENLRKLPTDRDIVVYCYTGHTGAVATAVLGTLGYHRVKNMKYGFAAWTQDPTARATTVYSAATDVHQYQITTGTAP